MRVLVSAAAAIIACAATAQEAPKASVEAPKVPFTETRHGRKVDDPYRWLEDTQRARELTRFVCEQSNITIANLSVMQPGNRLETGREAGRGGVDQKRKNKR